MGGWGWLDSVKLRLTQPQVKLELRLSLAKEESRFQLTDLTHVVLLKVVTSAHMAEQSDNEIQQRMEFNLH